MVRRWFLFGLFIFAFSLSAFAVELSTLQLQCTPASVSVGENVYCDLSLIHPAQFVAVEGSLTFDTSILGSVQMTPLAVPGFTGEYNPLAKQFTVSADDPASLASNNGIAHFVFTPQLVGSAGVTVHIDSLNGPAPGFAVVSLDSSSVTSNSVTISAAPSVCLDVSKITTSTGVEAMQKSVCESAGCSFSSTTKLCTGTATSCPSVVLYTPDTAYANGVRQSLCESVSGCAFKEGSATSTTNHVGDSCSNAPAPNPNLDSDSDGVLDSMDTCPTKGGTVYHDGPAPGCPVGDTHSITAPFNGIVNKDDLAWIKSNPHLFWTSVLKGNINNLNAFIKGMVENWSS